MRYFFDTEFIEQVDYLYPISLGIVSDDNRTYYAINSECDFSRANNWVKQNVISKLPPKTNPSWMTRERIAKTIREFVGSDSKPEFWAYYAAYDWVLFNWLLGGKMIDLPKGWPYHCMDLKQSMVERGFKRSQLPMWRAENAHDALADAQWLKTAHGAVYAV